MNKPELIKRFVAESSVDQVLSFVRNDTNGFGTYAIQQALLLRPLSDIPEIIRNADTNIVMAGTDDLNRLKIIADSLGDRKLTGDIGDITLEKVSAIINNIDSSMASYLLDNTEDEKIESLLIDKADKIDVRKYFWKYINNPELYRKAVSLSPQTIANIRERKGLSEDFETIASTCLTMKDSVLAHILALSAEYIPDRRLLENWVNTEDIQVFGLRLAKLQQLGGLEKHLHRLSDISMFMIDDTFDPSVLAKQCLSLSDELWSQACRRELKHIGTLILQLPMGKRLQQLVQHRSVPMTLVTRSKDDRAKYNLLLAHSNWNNDTKEVLYISQDKQTIDAAIQANFRTQDYTFMDEFKDADTARPLKSAASRKRKVSEEKDDSSKSQRIKTVDELMESLSTEDDEAIIEFFNQLQPRMTGDRWLKIFNKLSKNKKFLVFDWMWKNRDDFEPPLVSFTFVLDILDELADISHDAESLQERIEKIKQHKWLLHALGVMNSDWKGRLKAFTTKLKTILSWQAERIMELISPEISHNFPVFRLISRDFERTKLLMSKLPENLEYRRSIRTEADRGTTDCGLFKIVQYYYKNKEQMVTLLNIRRLRVSFIEEILLMAVLCGQRIDANFRREAGLSFGEKYELNRLADPQSTENKECLEIMDGKGPPVPLTLPGSILVIGIGRWDTVERMAMNPSVRILPEYAYMIGGKVDRIFHKSRAYTDERFISHRLTTENDLIESKTTPRNWNSFTKFSAEGFKRFVATIKMGDRYDYSMDNEIVCNDCKIFNIHMKKEIIIDSRFPIKSVVLQTVYGLREMLNIKHKDQIELTRFFIKYAPLEITIAHIKPDIAIFVENNGILAEEGKILDMAISRNLRLTDVDLQHRKKFTDLFGMIREKRAREVTISFINVYDIARIIGEYEIEMPRDNINDPKSLMRAVDEQLTLGDMIMRCTMHQSVLEAIADKWGTTESILFVRKALHLFLNGTVEWDDEVLDRLYQMNAMAYANNNLPHVLTLPNELLGGECNHTRLESFLQSKFGPVTCAKAFGKWGFFERVALAAEDQLTVVLTRFWNGNRDLIWQVKDIIKCMLISGVHNEEYLDIDPNLRLEYPYNCLCLYLLESDTENDFLKKLSLKCYDTKINDWKERGVTGEDSEDENDEERKLSPEMAAELSLVDKQTLPAGWVRGTFINTDVLKVVHFAYNRGRVSKAIVEEICASIAQIGGDIETPFNALLGGVPPQFRTKKNQEKSLVSEGRLTAGVGHILMDDPTNIEVAYKMVKSLKLSYFSIIAAEIVLLFRKTLLPQLSRPAQFAQLWMKEYGIQEYTDPPIGLGSSSDNDFADDLTNEIRRQHKESIDTILKEHHSSVSMEDYLLAMSDDELGPRIIAYAGVKKSQDYGYMVSLAMILKKGLPRTITSDINSNSRLAKLAIATNHLSVIESIGNYHISVSDLDVSDICHNIDLNNTSAITRLLVHVKDNTCLAEKLYLSLPVEKRSYLFPHVCWSFVVVNDSEMIGRFQTDALLKKMFYQKILATTDPEHVPKLNISHDYSPGTITETVCNVDQGLLLNLYTAEKDPKDNIILQFLSSEFREQVALRHPISVVVGLLQKFSVITDPQETWFESAELMTILARMDLPLTMVPLRFHDQYVSVQKGIRTEFVESGLSTIYEVSVTPLSGCRELRNVLWCPLPSTTEDERFFWNNLHMDSVSHLSEQFRKNALFLLIADHFIRRQPMVKQTKVARLLPPLELFSKRFLKDDRRTVIAALIDSLSMFPVETVQTVITGSSGSFEMGTEYLIWYAMNTHLLPLCIEKGLTEDTLPTIGIILSNFGSGLGLAKVWPKNPEDVLEYYGDIVLPSTIDMVLALIWDGFHLREFQEGIHHQLIRQINLPLPKTIPEFHDLWLPEMKHSLTQSMVNQFFSPIFSVISPIIVNDSNNNNNNNNIDFNNLTETDSFTDSWLDNRWTQAVNSEMRDQPVKATKKLVKWCLRSEESIQIIDAKASIPVYPELELRVREKTHHPRPPLTTLEERLINIWGTAPPYNLRLTPRERIVLVTQLISLLADKGEKTKYIEIDELPAHKDKFIMDLIHSVSARMSMKPFSFIVPILFQTGGFTKVNPCLFSQVHVSLHCRYQQVEEKVDWDEVLVHNTDDWPDIIARFGPPKNTDMLAWIMKSSANTHIPDSYLIQKDFLKYAFEMRLFNIADTIIDTYRTMQADLYTCWLAFMFGRQLGPQKHDDRIRRMAGPNATLKDRLRWNHYCFLSGHVSVRAISNRIVNNKSNNDSPITRLMNGHHFGTATTENISVMCDRALKIHAFSRIQLEIHAHHIMTRPHFAEVSLAELSTTAPVWVQKYFLNIVNNRVLQS